MVLCAVGKLADLQLFICMHPALSHDSRTLSIPKQTPTCQQSHIITTVQAIQILLQKGRAWWHFMGTKHRCVSWGWVHRHDKADPNGAFSAKWFTRHFWGDLKVKELQPNPSCVIWINLIYPCIMGFQGDQFDKSFSQLSLHHGLPLDSTLGDPKNWTVRLLLRLEHLCNLVSTAVVCGLTLSNQGAVLPMRICRNISSRVRKGAESLSLEYTSKDPFPEEWCPRIVRWCESLPAFASHDKVVAFKLWEDTSSRSPVWGFRSSTNQRDASSEVTLRWLHFPSLLGDGRTAPRPKLAKSRDTALAIFSLNIPEGELGRMKRQNTPRFPLLAILDAL